MAAESSIEIIEPLVRAWRRTRRLLFAPFAFERWAIFGFSAWLALWVGAGGGVHFTGLLTPPGRSPGGFGGSRDEVSTWFFGLALAVIGTLAAVALIWIVFRTWIQSRFEFVFLHQLRTGDTAVAKPWADSAHQGNSLFVGRVLVGLVFLTLMLLPIGLSLGAGLRPGLMSIGSTIVALILLVPLAFLGLFLVFAINHFVIPIMACQGVTFQPALARFRDLFSSFPGPILLYTLFYWVLSFTVGLVILAVGFATCCLGFLVLALPYVGAVLLLPIAVCGRYYGLEFLRQFGPEFDLLSPPV